MANEACIYANLVGSTGSPVSLAPSSSAAVGSLALTALMTPNQLLESLAIGYILTSAGGTLATGATVVLYGTFDGTNWFPFYTPTTPPTDSQGNLVMVPPGVCGVRASCLNNDGSKTITFYAQVGALVAQLK